ncbi:hypothetical protein [Shewanella sp. T24-MNA-CIBAN-0130]|uniref:hypothetical protein n=1 Tax=Shewanella sp. T24-MNA-CIBAN-0130 TaxID=3140470 RepID=UPI0033178755
MGLPVTVYRWDDVGAPQMSASPTPSEVIAVLKACLVNGYGTKAPLGWSIAFEDVATSKIAFRNSTTEGSGGFVQYWSENGTNNPNTQVHLRTGSAMSALDVFSHPSNLFNHYNLSSASEWVIVGTSISYCAIPRYDGHNLNYLSPSYNEVSYIIGDLDSNYINDITRFNIFANNTRTDITAANYSHSLAYQGVNACSSMYGVDGNTKQNSHVIDYGISVGLTNSNDTLELTGVIPVLIPVVVRTTSPALTDIDGIKCSLSNKNPFIRGTIAGLYNICFCGYGDEQWPTIKNWNGQDYMLLRGYFNSTWINITEWY